MGSRGLSLHYFGWPNNVLYEGLEMLRSFFLTHYCYDNHVACVCLE